MLVKIIIPNIGNYVDVPIIDIPISVNDSIKIDDIIVVLETDKSTLEIPSTIEGVVKEICVKIGDKVSQGDLAFLFEVDDFIDNENKNQKNNILNKKTNQRK